MPNFLKLVWIGVEITAGQQRRSGFATLRQLNPIHKKGAIKGPFLSSFLNDWSNFTSYPS